MTLFPPSRVIAVDVDGTLIQQGIMNQELLDWIRRQKSRGYLVMLWSARGAEYSQAAAKASGAADLFDVICGKPGYVVDDLGWTWIRHTKVISDLDDLS